MKDGLIISRVALNTGVDDVFTEEEIKTWVRRYCYPEDVFPLVELNAWAESHGFVKEQEE